VHARLHQHLNIMFGELQFICSKYNASRQCLNNINCAEGDVGYEEVKGFGSFSKSILKSNEIDAMLMLCASREGNQSLR